MAFQIEPYSVADFVEWSRGNRLRLNPDFQRRDAWSPAEKTLLIDTILRGLSMPKIYFRTVIDSKTQAMVRDVVDGQQRLRSVIAFANNELKLGKKAEEFEGKKYKDLTEKQQQDFLQYRIATEQLINASDEDVVFIFTRLNQYGARLNQAEIRNAEFDNAVKWVVVDLSSKWWKTLLETGFITLKQRSRMIDDEIIAELLQIHLLGVRGGDARALRDLYESAKRFDSDLIKSQINNILTIITNSYSDTIPQNIKSRPHFVMLYAAFAEAVIGIPNVEEYKRPDVVYRLPNAGDEMTIFAERLAEFGKIIASDDYPGEEWEDFYNTSRSAPINIRSRKVRFPVYLDLFAHETDKTTEAVQ